MVNKMVGDVTVLRSKYNELLKRRDMMKNEIHNEAIIDNLVFSEAKSVTPIKTRSVQQQESFDRIRRDFQVK